jgi:hypothetical protein
MSTLHPKFSVSVYSEGHQFNKEPYDMSRGFAIHTLKREEPTQSLAEKFKLSLTSTNWKDMYSSSPNRKLVKPIETPKTQYEQESPIDYTSYEKTQEVRSPTSNSKFKSKLEKDVERANDYNHDTNKQIKTKESGRPAELIVHDGIVSPSKTQMMTKSTLTSPNKNSFLIGYSTGRSTRRPGTTIDFIKERTKSSALQRTLYYDTRTSSIPKTALKNPVIEDLIAKEDFIMTNPALLQSIVKLRDMNLLKQNSPGVNRFKGVGKVDYVYNDFHARNTNPGYSRNTGGVFYCR